MPDVQDMSLKYGGRVLRIEIFLNTNQEAIDIIRRIKDKARGKNLDAAVVIVREYKGEQAKELWETLVDASVEATTKPF